MGQKIPFSGSRDTQEVKSLPNKHKVQTPVPPKRKKKEKR
jgi:hypothetical protein